MSLIEINWNPEKREIRKFGFIAFVAFGAAGIILGLPAVWAISAAAAGLFILIVTLISPAAGRIIYLALTFAALPIGLVVSFIVMAAFYFLILTPVGLVFKIIGRDSLTRRFEPDSPTYWTPHKRTDDHERYFHQS
jgi:hypothetical protein